MAETPPTFPLWLLGLISILGPWLALGFAAVLATLALQKVSRMARDIEDEPVAPGHRGFWRLVGDAFTHRSLTESSFRIVIGCVMFAGFVAAGIHGLVRRALPEDLPAGLIELDPPAPAPSLSDTSNAQGEGVIDLIILGGLIMACVTVMAGVIAYRRLRRRAMEIDSHAPSRATPRPLLARLFIDNKSVGIVVVVVGCWILWGFLTQVVGLAVITLPGLRTLSSIPGVETAAILFLLILGTAMSLVFFGPFVWMTVRNVKLQIRHIRENRIARRLFHVQAVVLCGLLGGMLNLYLIEWLGRTLWPSIFDR